MTATPAQAARGFKFGVAAQEVRQHSAILWARSTKAGPVRLEVRRRGPFGACGGSGSLRARATKPNNLTVQRKVRGLRPGKRYRYRFCRRGGRSEVGRFRTAPRPGANRVIRFAWSGDQDGQPAPGEKRPFWNNFGVLRQMRSERNHFNILLGDTIYSDSEVAGIVSRAITVAAKWAKYRQTVRQRPLAALRSSAATYSHWDDHEFINDFSRHESRADLNIPISPEKLYRNGVRAFRDYHPVTYSRRNGIYRTVRWGKNLQLFFLDERSFRSAKASAGGACDNPQGSGNPDLAPTAPQNPTRNTFGTTGVLPGLEQLLNPPPPGCNATINSPNRTLLGARQLARFKRAVRRSTATFKVIVNEVPIQQFYALPYDRWEGYEHERQEVLTYLRNNVDNVVFLTTDVHANMVNDARLRTLEPPSPKESGIMDVTTGPIATKPFMREIDDIAGPGSGNLVTNAFFKVPPATPPAYGGAGQTCSATDVFSYGEVAVSRTQLRIELKDIDGNPVREGPNGSGATCPNNSTVTIPAS